MYTRARWQEPAAPNYLDVLYEDEHVVSLVTAGGCIRPLLGCQLLSPLTCVAPAASRVLCAASGKPQGHKLRL